MSSKKIRKKREELFKEASRLSADGNFSKSDYESLTKSWGKVKGWDIGRQKSDLARYIAKALHENNAVLDSDAQDLANKYNKGGITQTRDSSGRLMTSFRQSTGGRDMIERRGKGRDEWFEGEFGSAPISNIEHKSWTQYGPNSPSTSKWDVYTRTYTHSPKPEEPVAKEEPPKTETKPDIKPGKDLTDARSRWDQSGGQGSIGYDPTSGGAPGVVDGVGAAADYGNRATDDYHKRFIPHLNAQANLEALEMGYAGGVHLDKFEGKVPELASGDIKDLYDYYSKKITA